MENVKALKPLVGTKIGAVLSRSGGTPEDGERQRFILGAVDLVTMSESGSEFSEKAAIPKMGS